MRPRLPWVGGLFLALSLSLASFGLVSARASRSPAGDRTSAANAAAAPDQARAEQPTPIITTPTPTPLPPTPQPTLREFLMTPAAQRKGAFVYLPVVVNENDGRYYDVNPRSFTYTVKSGDSLWSLALDFGRDLDTMSCITAPLSDDAETLTPGQTVTIPALSDLCYTVTPGDTLTGIATNHGLSIDAIVEIPWNGFEAPPYNVQPRQRVLLPGAKRAAIPRANRQTVSRPSDSWASSPWPNWPYGDGKFIWPVDGPVTQGARAGHMAIDIAVPLGTPVKAADRGKVVMAGWNPTGYGFRVVIDHGNDYMTLYAHLSDIYVESGDVVGKGQVIGVSGANGNITGPHLHFEIRDFGVLTDPLPLLTQ